jgi:ABC-type dipeptide/oligopeptide/nickel transport system permease subunit
MLAQAIIAIIRTAVPAAVGTAIGWLAAHGLNIDPVTQQLLIGGLITAGIALYYALVTFLERKVHPAFGWLLGAAKAPTYDATSKLDGSSPTGVSAAVASPLPDGTPVAPTEPVL